MHSIYVLLLPSVIIGITLFKIMIYLLNLCCENFKYGIKNSTQGADFFPPSLKQQRNSFLGFEEMSRDLLSV